MSAERIRELLDGGLDICPLEDVENDPETECSRERARLVAALRVAVPAFEKIVRGDYINDGTPKGQAKRALAAIEKALRGEK
jgi:hypothetical protein